VSYKVVPIPPSIPPSGTYKGDSDSDAAVGGGSDSDVGGGSGSAVGCGSDSAVGGGTATRLHPLMQRAGHSPYPTLRRRAHSRMEGVWWNGKRWEHSCYRCNACTVSVYAPMELEPPVSGKSASHRHKGRTFPQGAVSQPAQRAKGPASLPRVASRAANNTKRHRHPGWLTGKACTRHCHPGCQPQPYGWY